MSVLQRQREADEMESQEEEQVMDKDHIQAIRQEVWRDFEQTISHPIQIEGVNVCELWRAGKHSWMKYAGH